jgi:alpha-tubulin suppressor-like RCC1 family protein
VKHSGRRRRMAAVTIVAALAGAVSASTTVFAGAGSGGDESGASLQAWGHGISGQLGDGELGEKGLPVAVQGLLCVKSVALSELDSFAVLANGHVDAWGEDSGTPTGELGDDGAHEPHSEVPLEVAGITEAKQIAADTPDVYVLLDSGTITGWGDDRDGEYGLGTTSIPEANLPETELGGFTGGVEAVAAANATALALLSNGKVFAWGMNNGGQLGNGTQEGPAEATPAEVKNSAGTGKLEHIKAIGIGATFADALTEGGEVVAWGAHNSSFGLGAGLSHSESALPVTVEDPAGMEPLKEVTAISVGADHVLALLKSGKVVAWGADALGQLGNGEESTAAVNNDRPVEVKGLTGVVAIAATEDSSYALLSNGTVWAWGNNTQEQLGVGSTAHSIDEPVQISALGSETSSLGAGSGAQTEMALGPVTSNCGSTSTTTTSTASSTTSTATSTSVTQTTTTAPVTTSTTSVISTATGNPNEPVGKGGFFHPGTFAGNGAASGGVLATALGLPPAKACFSHRSFAIHVHQPAGYPKILSAEVLLGHKREGTVRGKRISSQVDLRGVPAGTFTILIRAHLANGQTITGTRTYHTCAKHRLKGHHHKL